MVATAAPRAVQNHHCFTMSLPAFSSVGDGWVTSRPGDTWGSALALGRTVVSGTGGAGGTGTQSGTGAPGSMSDIYSWMDPSGQRQFSTDDWLNEFGSGVDNPNYGYLGPAAPTGNAAASDPGYANLGGGFYGLEDGWF